MGAYLFSATLIILLVFLPLLSLGGIEGAMFRPTAFAVAAGLFGALALNLTLQPALGSLLLAGRRPARPSALNQALTRAYARLLKRALDRRTLVIVVFAVMIGGAAFGFLYLGTEFVPPLDEGAILASTVMLPETSLEEGLRETWEWFTENQDEYLKKKNYFVEV